MSHVTCNSQTVRARELKFWEKDHLLPPVTCHFSHVRFHVSHVRCHMPRVTCHMSGVACHLKKIYIVCVIFFIKCWSYLVEGLLTTGPTPSSLHSNWDNTIKLFSCVVLKSGIGYFAIYTNPASLGAMGHKPRIFCHRDELGHYTLVEWMVVNTFDQQIGKKYFLIKA